MLIAECRAGYLQGILTEGLIRLLLLLGRSARIGEDMRYAFLALRRDRDKSIAMNVRVKVIERLDRLELSYLELETLDDGLAWLT